jgi:beta-lactamase regulating signal transducer with metallopeptidase domain
MALVGVEICRKLRLVTEQPLTELLEDCKQLTNVRTVVGLAITDRVKSPFLFGFVRPRILIPAGLQNHIPMEEMQYIFLHELAHLKRSDIWIGWIVAVLQSFHWFNPLVWWAFIRMRADRELACDALALSYLRSKDSGSYGSAPINLLEKFDHSQRLPAVAGILENKPQLKRRLTMIAHFNRPTRKASIFAAALLVALATGLLTNAKEFSNFQPSSTVPSSTVVTKALQNATSVQVAEPCKSRMASQPG